MGMFRNALLWGSENKWLERQFRNRGFAKAAVSRFMPGEQLDDALAAAAELQRVGIPTILTCLGENVTSAADVDEVVDHYLRAYDRIHERGLDTHISIKPTHLGLDIDRDGTAANLTRLADRAADRDNVLWIDMEHSPYVDATLDLYRQVKAGHDNVGLCLQAYLHRSGADLEALLEGTATIRLVKGAYNEPAEVAFHRKRDVDHNFLDMAKKLVDHGADGGSPVTPHAIATHDLDLIQAVRAHAVERGYDAEAFEIDMLYGIRASEQRRLAEAGVPTRVLISYGEAWFPWYMRRLAERPANVGFVVRSMFMH